MQSNGGVTTTASGRRRPVHVIESGPAAGVIATAELARRVGRLNAISTAGRRGLEGWSRSAGVARASVRLAG
jgi:Hydantoinase/oxoprolinase